MIIRESLAWEGRTVAIDWLPAPFEPPRDQITQASGVCFTTDGRIVLVAGQMSRWALPGGHVEPGETIEQTLKREVLEEACAIVRRSVYLGAQKVSDPHNPGGPREYYQARCWARVALKPFKPKFERTQRTLVAPAEFVSTLQWQTTGIALALLDAALAAERRFKARIMD